MASDAPTILVPFVPQPIVAQDLCVEIVCLERRMMDLGGRPLNEEEDVVVDFLAPSV